MKKILAALLLVVMLSAVSIVQVTANDVDDDGDGVDDEIENAEERELHIEVSDSHAEVESEFENETMENEFGMQFNAEEGISIELEYKNETEREGEEEIEAELELKVQFLTIVEYFDNDTSGCLTENDTIVQIIYLTDLAYAPLEFTNITSPDGEAGYRFEYMGALSDFKFNITAVLFPIYAIVDNTLVTPTETKITITITNFPYNDTTGASALALQVKATSKMEIEKENETMESEIKVESDNAMGYFNWENWAMVNNVNSTVNNSLTKTDEGTLINLCYPHGSNIVHDPKLGVRIKVPLDHIFTLITPELLIGTAIAATVVAVAAITLTRRRRKLQPLETTAPLAL